MRAHDAAAQLQQALTIAETIANPTQLWKTYLAAGRLKTNLKKRDEARAAYQQARSVVDRVRANLQNQALRASFECSSIIRQIYQLNDTTHE